MNLFTTAGAAMRRLLTARARPRAQGTGTAVEAAPAAAALWHVEGQSIDAREFAHLPVQEVLYEMAQPMLYRTSHKGQAALMYLCDESPQHSVERWLLVPLVPGRFIALLENRLTLHEAMSDVPLHVLERSSDGVVVRAWAVADLRHIPSDHKPREGVFLRHVERPSAC